MTFDSVLNIFIITSLILTSVQIYLRVNKIWKRKHEREVADSQSIAGLTLYFLNCILWLFYYLVSQDDALSMIDTSFYLVEATVFLLISTGLWVRGQERIGIWNLAKKALRLERKEADYLIKRFFKPANADNIMSILHQLAMIDNEMDPKEKLILESFAKEWNIEYNEEKFNKDRKKSKTQNYVRLRSSLADYLRLDPPRDQVAQFRDMMNAIINADDKVTEEEELINSELMGIINSYLNKDNRSENYYVLVVPQKPEHEEVINEMLPEAVRMSVSGGTAYSIGSYYSRTYADMICRQYQQIQLFTIVHSPENDEIEGNTKENETTE